MVETDKYAEPRILHHSNLTILSSQAGCAKFSNLCQPFGPELTSLVIHYGRQRRDSFLNNISWGSHWGWWWRIINFSSSSALTRANWSPVQLVCLLWNLSSIGSKHCDHPAVSHRVISQVLASLTDFGSPTTLMMILDSSNSNNNLINFRTPERVGELQRCGRFERERLENQRLW